MEFSTLKGFKDVLPGEVGNWQKFEGEARKLFHAFGFQEVKIPVLERTELFSRSIGQETDIVSKEMFTLYDSKNRGMTMRPEATASITRAYIQHRMYQKNPIQKLFTIGPMFRHEQPQHLRFRQFHQIDVELFGDPGPKSDAEIITLAMYLFESVGFKDLALHLNSLGCPECRPRFREALRHYLNQKANSLCTDCVNRYKNNPLRVFDCKVESCGELVADAPSLTEYLCENCQIHFQSLQDYLNRLHIPFVQNHRLVRGLDYYARTTFELQTERMGAQNAVAGGGRYDGLVKLLGGPDHPGIGFAIGMERVVALMDEDNPSEPGRVDLFIAALGEKAEKKCFQWAYALRKSGLWVELDYGSKGLKSQMKKAGRLGAKKVLIVGDNEIASGMGVLRDMDKKTQSDIPLENNLSPLEEVLRCNGKR